MQHRSNAITQYHRNNNNNNNNNSNNSNNNDNDNDDVIWLSGTVGGACSCCAHVHGGMFKKFGWTLHRGDLAVRYLGRSVQLFCSRSW